MAVDLTGIPIAEASPRILDFGGVVGSEIGGASLRVNRLGTRWAWRFRTVPLRMGASGRYWSGMLAQARWTGARLKVSQPEIVIGDPGAPVAAATPSGRVVAVSGLTPGYPVRRGLWLSFERAAGDRYLDMNLNDVAANGSGQATLLIQNLLRAPLAAGDVVNMVNPKIEGWLTGLDSWTIDRGRMTVFEFVIEEAA